MIHLGHRRVITAVLLAIWPLSLSAGTSTGDYGSAEIETPQAATSPITFGRALDIEGTPLRLARPSVSFGRGSGAGPAYKGPFQRPSGLPLRASGVSSSFGMRWHPVLGGYRFHSGLDIPAATGTAVYSTSPGMVQEAGWCGGYGLCVVIDHGQGYQTLFAHLSAITVPSGKLVAAGQLVGQVGSTGRSTGPHLHYEVRRNGQALDPRGFL